jgi:hypothetical protein
MPEGRVLKNRGEIMATTKTATKKTTATTKTWTYTVLAKGDTGPLLRFTGTVTAKTRLAANRAAVKVAIGRKDLCLFDVVSVAQ